MHTYLPFDTMLFALLIYYKLRETELKKNSKLTLRTFKVLFSELREKFETKKEEDYWQNLSSNFDLKLLENIFPELEERFKLKYEHYKEPGMFEKVNLYDEVIDDDVTFSDEIIKHIFEISYENTDFLQYFEEYLEMYAQSKFKGEKVYKYLEQKEILEEIFSQYIQKAGNNYIILSYDELLKINNNYPVAVLEYIAYNYGLDKYNIDKYNYLEPQGCFLYNDLSKFEIHFHKNIQEFSDNDKQIIYFSLKGSTVTEIKYCKKTIKLSENEMFIVSVLFNAKNHREFAEKLLENPNSTKLSLKTAISKLNKKFKNIQKELNFSEIKKIIISEINEEKACEYLINIDYTVKSYQL